MHLKKGDIVKVLTGKDRGKTGKVLYVNPKKQRATVEGLNLYTRHERPKKMGQKGQRLQVPMAVHVSNLQITKAKKASTPKPDKPTGNKSKQDSK